MYELFMDIPGYEGLYQVSNLGRVRNIKRGRILKPRKDKYGYMLVDLYKDKKGKTFKVHRLVISTFKANPDNKPQVNHINEDKTDNKLNNLEWCTAKENGSHGTRPKRIAETNRQKGTYDKMKTTNSKKVFCVETGQTYDSALDASKHVRLASGCNINACCKGKQKTAGGYHWKYCE